MVPTGQPVMLMLWILLHSKFANKKSLHRLVITAMIGVRNSNLLPLGNRVLSHVNQIRAEVIVPARCQGCHDVMVVHGRAWSCMVAITALHMANVDLPATVMVKSLVLSDGGAHLLHIAWLQGKRAP